MLYRVILAVLVTPLMDALEPQRGAWSSSLGGAAHFFHLLFIILVPGLVLAAPMVFSVQGLLAAHCVKRRRRTAIAAGMAPAYALLSGVMAFVASLGSLPEDDLGQMALTTPVAVVLPVSALSLLCFWLPIVVCGSYTTLSKNPRWWLAGAVGTGTLILGLWLWIVLGVLVGAPVD